MSEKTVFSGHFSYSFEETSEKRIDFRLYISELNGSFHGYSVDAETEKLFAEKSVVIKGFIEDDLISFTKTYPNSYFMNENGELEVENGSKPYVVVYEGYWYQEKEQFSGEYTVETEIGWKDGRQTEYLSEIYEGHWEMKREM